MEELAFTLDISDYNLWRHEPMPVFLVLFDATRRRAFWLYIQAYFNAHPEREPRHNAQFVLVRIPKRNRINARAINYMQKVKADVLAQLDGVIIHHD